MIKQGRESRVASAEAVRGLVDVIRDDIRSAVRSLRAHPAFVAVIVLCLAIGIGANIAMFGIANLLFLRPPAGIRNADALVRLYVIRHQGMSEAPLAYPDFIDLTAARTAFTGVATYRHAVFTVGHGAEAEQVQGEYASPNYLRLLGTRMATGRFFTADEDSVRGRRLAAVLSYDYWRSHFHGRDVIGHAIAIDNQPFTIVGVTERGFHGAGFGRVDIWEPAAQVPMLFGSDPLHVREIIGWDAIGRRAPGISMRRAMVEATAMLSREAASDPLVDPHVRVSATALSGGLGPDAPPHGSLILWLFGAVGFVLVIACANVANLLLARAVQRRRDLAVRLSLGIGRWRLARELLIESAILALAGGALGLLIAWWSTAAWKTLGLAERPTPWDPRVLAFASGLALMTAIAFGLAPALTATRTDLSLVLKDGTPSAGRIRAPARGILIALQAALSLIVLAGGGLFVRSLQRLSAFDLGIDAKHVVFVDALLPPGQIDPTGLEAIEARILARLAALPGVRGSAISQVGRFRGTWGVPVLKPGPDSIPEGARKSQPWIDAVGPSYAQALGTPLIRGRDITAADRAGTLPVVVVSQRMARVYWPGQDPIGQCLVILGPPTGDEHSCTYVVGVVGDATLMRITEQPALFCYVPRTQRSMPFPPTLIVRTNGETGGMLKEIRDAVAQVAPEVLYTQVNTVPIILADQLEPYRLGALLFTIFGIAALGLTAVGLYSVIAYLAVQRTREVGIRVALGATALGVVTLIARQGARPLFAGLVSGLAGAFIVTRYLQHLLYHVSPTDGPAFAVAIGLLAFVAVIACVVPALRAARIDPVVALRAE